MPADEQSIINTAAGPRTAEALRLVYQALDGSGEPREACGLEVEGDLPLMNPWALRRTFAQLPWPDGIDPKHDSPEVQQIEYRGAGQTVAHFIVTTTETALYGAAVVSAVKWVAKQLNPWARPAWKRGPNPPQTGDELLAFATSRAQSIAYDYCRDIDHLVVIAQSLSETATLENASATVVFRAPDNTTVHVHLWFADGAIRHTFTRIPPS